MRRSDSLEKTLMLGKIEGARRSERQRMRWLDGITNSMAMSLSILARKISMDRWTWLATVHGGHKDSDMTEILSERTNTRVRTHTHTYTHTHSFMTFTNRGSIIDGIYNSTRSNMLFQFTSLAISSIQFSHSVMSDSLQPHGLLQHVRPLCPSPTPGAFSNSCPLSWWFHPTISSSVIPFSSCL